MKTPLRILTASAHETQFARPSPSARDIERKTAILTAATTLMVRHGPHGITFSDLASALGITRAALKKFFPDLDNLLATIVTRHFLAILDALKAIPADTKDQFQASRAAYIAATRTGLGAPTEAQCVTTQYRHLLPQDEQDNIGHLRQPILFMLGGANPEITLSFLDNPHLTLNQIEALAATLEALPEPVWADLVPPPLPKRGPRPFVLPPGNTAFVPDLSRTGPVEHRPMLRDRHEARAGP
jgi:AcrR family transcriptional regulator